MHTADVQLLYEYDRWANHRVLQASSGLTPEQFTRDLGGGFRTVRDTLLHIIAGEWIWLTYWKNPPRDAAALADLRQRKESEFRPEDFPSVAAVKSKWEEVERQQVEFVESMTDAALEARLPFRGSEFKLAHLMQHLANHSTYHRGQLALMLRQLGGEPLATDFHVFLVEGRGQTPGGSERQGHNRQPG